MTSRTDSAKAPGTFPSLPGADDSKPSAPRASKPDAVSLSDVTYDRCDARTPASALFLRPGYAPHTKLCTASYSVSLSMQFILINPPPPPPPPPLCNPPSMTLGAPLIQCPWQEPVI